MREFQELGTTQKNLSMLKSMECTYGTVKLRQSNQTKPNTESGRGFGESVLNTNLTFLGALNQN